MHQEQGTTPVLFPPEGIPLQARSYLHRIGALLCLLLFFVVSMRLWAQNGGQPPSPAASLPTSTAADSGSVPTFHASSRLVLVDVVATDKSGKFVPGLKTSDFSVLEDGKPQRIAGFSEHVAEHTAPPPLNLPPHQFTNFTMQPTGQAINIILLDLLNTPFLEQAYARKQMLKFLADLPPGHNVALFALNSRLSLIQGFTGSSATLVAAAKALQLNNSTSHLITTEQDRQDAESIGASIGQGTYDLSQGTAAALTTAMTEQQDYQAEVRINMILQSLQWIARSTSGYIGRKNLLWLSSQFPFRMDPEFNQLGQSRYDRDHTAEILETASLMTSSQIAVYPISVRGLASNPSVSIAASSSLGLSNPSLVSRQTTDRWDEQDAMADIARQTGGFAFYGGNDLKAAMLRSIDEGSNYYTLAYAPTNSDWNGRYRKIEVKSGQNHVELRFRRGYYAIREKEFTGDQAAKMLAAAMLPTVPESTMLLLRVQVLPPDQEHKAVRIDYAVEAQDIAFADAPDKRKHADIDFMAAAFDRQNQDAAHVTDTMQATIRPELFDQVLKTGLPMHQELEVKPGSYLLRLGVIDRGSQKIGTVDVPLTIPGEEAAKK